MRPDLHSPSPGNPDPRLEGRAFGDAVAFRERTGGAWSRRWLDDLGRDLRHAVRGLRRSPGFAATVSLILALGIGANTAIFSIVYGILLRPLPYPDASAIVRVGELADLGGVPELRLSNRAMPLLQENAGAFEQLAAYRRTSARWEGGVTLRGARVSPSLFPLFRAAPHLGRLFLEEEARAGAEPVVLLSHRAWTNRFAADPTVVGSTVEVDEESRLVVGVVTEGFHFPDPDTEFWTPYDIRPYTPPNPEGTAAQPGRAVVSLQSFMALGRLRPGVSTEQAATEARSILQGHSDAFQALAGGEREVRVVPLLEEMVGEYRPALSILASLTVLMLLAACLNAAGLLLARGVARRRLLAISAALGASRGRLVRQLLTEGTVLSLSGGVLGLALRLSFCAPCPLSCRATSRVWTRWGSTGSCSPSPPGCRSSSGWCARRGRRFSSLRSAWCAR